MALVNPNIAMSFKPTTEYQPRNALADYAQMQQIQTGDMQMQEYRRKSEGLERIRNAISKAGGPNDLETAAQEMMKVPEYFNQGYEIYQTIRDKKAFEEYLKGKEQPAGVSPSGAPTAARPAQGALSSGTFDPTAPAANYMATGDNPNRPIMDRINQMAQSAPKDTRVRGIATEQDLAQQQLLNKFGFGSTAPTTAPTNALAPATAAAPVAAPTNALVNPVEAVQNEIIQLSRFKDPRAQARVKQLERQLAVMEPTADVKTMKALGYPLTAQGYEQYREAQRQDQLSVADRIAIAQASRAAGGGGGRAPRTQVTQLADGSIALVNLDTGQIVPAAMAGQQVKGKLSAAEQKQQIQQSQLNKEIPRTIKELENISKDGGLIDQSTGSGAGRLIDIGARFAGQAMPGDIARGKLAPIADMVLKMVPRFEGPQSDKDTQSYKEAAGQLADSSLPRDIRKAAAKEITRLMKERQGQFGTSDMTPPTGATTLTPEDQQALNWANSNPKDPRAFQIKQRLGQ